MHRKGQSQRLSVIIIVSWPLVWCIKRMVNNSKWSSLAMWAFIFGCKWRQWWFSGWESWVLFDSSIHPQNFSIGGLLESSCNVTHFILIYHQKRQTMSKMQKHFDVWKRKKCIVLTYKHADIGMLSWVRSDCWLGLWIWIKTGTNAIIKMIKGRLILFKRKRVASSKTRRDTLQICM